MPRMLEKIRRASHQLSDPLGRRKSSTSSQVANNNDTLVGPSFLSLPPEIRNQIYEELALDTCLGLTPPRSRKKGSDPIGLLLACRQTAQEYRPVLLSTASLQIYVSDYNFGNVIRVLERLAERDVDFLLANENLWIVLRLGHVPSREDRKSLRAWHDYRSGNIQPYFKQGSLNAGKLVFKYDAMFENNMRPPRPAARYANGYAMKFDLLRSHVRMYTALDDGEGGECGELHRLRADMERHSKVLADLRGESPEDANWVTARSASLASHQSMTRAR